MTRDTAEAAQPQERFELYPHARVMERSAHCISRREIPETVLKVLYRLHRSGYRAYLCGGSVRDLLMKRAPKDFDLATDAHPMEIRRLFRNSRIIGRRFRLAHILFQDRVVEVSTFRREPQRANDDAEILVTDDNTFGSPLEDARRRDFTINGLFYNISDFTVIDYVGGLEDLERRQIRVIGDPDLRFREDPVRMLRAVEFAARLNFEIEPETYQAILRHRNEIVKASPPRVSEEILELLRRGWALSAFTLLHQTGLLEPLLPELSRLLRSPDVSYVLKMLEVLDRTVSAGRRISDAVLLCVLLLPIVVEELEIEERRRPERLRPHEVMLLVRDQLQPIFQRLAIPAAVRHEIEQAVDMLWRLLEPPGDRKNVWKLVLRDPFQDALALAELFALSSGRYVDAFGQWKELAHRVRRASEHQVPQRPRRRRRGRGR
jgi:poly(A) polymerase